MFVLKLSGIQIYIVYFNNCFKQFDFSIEFSLVSRV